MAATTNEIGRTFGELEARDVPAAQLTAQVFGNGIMYIEGTAGGDRINVREQGGRLTVDDGAYYKWIWTPAGWAGSVPTSAVGRVYVNALGGNDWVDLSSLTRPAVVDAGAGNDVVFGGSGNDW